MSEGPLPRNTPARLRKRGLWRDGVIWVALAALVVLFIAVLTQRGNESERADRASDTALSLAQQVRRACAEGGATAADLGSACATAKAVAADPGILRGARGETGRTGESGPTGLRGPPGATGPRGAAALRGAKGDRGVPGKDGAPGADGKDGTPGAPGSDGAPGAPGSDGAPGAPGADGKDGVTPTTMYCTPPAPPAAVTGPWSCTFDPPASP